MARPTAIMSSTAASIFCSVRRSAIGGCRLSGRNLQAERRRSGSDPILLIRLVDG
jgi:hypothetical protein